VQSTGYELGARSQPFDGLNVATALWLLDLDSELVFNADAGGLDQPEGPTRRWGIDVETRYQALDWLSLAYDLSWADPRFTNGTAVPLAPTLVMDGSITAQWRNGFSAGARVRFVGDRPANESRTLTASGYAVIDVLGEYRWRNLQLSLALLNLTDTDWREAQFDDHSCIFGEIGNRPECSSRNGGNAGAEDIHFTPGNPLAVRGGVTVYF